MNTTSTDKVLNIATDFSEFPAGRYITDGPFSGEAFRENFLLPALKANQVIAIELDDAMGFGSSFLEEAFGGLVRLHGFSPDFIKSHIHLVTSRPYLITEIHGYLEDAGIAEQ